MAEQYARRDPDLKIIGLRFSNVLTPEDYKVFESFEKDPMSRAWNLWAYIDARVGAQAVKLAVENTQIKGAEGMGYVAIWPDRQDRLVQLGVYARIYASISTW